MGNALVRDQDMEMPEQVGPDKHGISVEYWSDVEVVEVLRWRVFSHDD